ncbi:MAG: hypothetical protein ACFB22_02495 [Rhodothalassiaceae bacterium]
MPTSNLNAMLRRIRYALEEVSEAEQECLTAAVELSVILHLKREVSTGPEMIAFDMERALLRQLRGLEQPKDAKQH